MPHVILFVDDEPEVLALLQRTFPASDGYETLTAPGGAEALEILARREVDLLVTDQRMPGMTGVELVAEARRRVPELCAILLTAYTNPREIVDSINRGEVYRYLVKPWESADLRQTVLRAIEQVHLKRDRARLTLELERRLIALQAASELARDVGIAGSHAQLLERVLDRIPEVVPCDVAAALLAPSGAPPQLLVRPVSDLSGRALERIRADACDAFAEHSGRCLAAETVRTRVLGGASGGDGAGAFASRLTVPVQLEGSPVGVIVLESVRVDAFGEGDARVLDILVNELAEALRALGETLLGERRRLERMIESLADGLVFAAHDADEVVANPAARRLLGAPDGPLTAEWLGAALGRSPFDAAEPGAPGPRSEEIRLPDRTLSAIVSPVPDAGGRLSGVAVVLRDVTEQKLLEERKEEFVQVVSHELRTPLTSITGALDLVLGGLAGPVEEKQARYLRMARDSAEKLNALVDDILDVARLAKGKMPMEHEVVQLDELVRAAAERYQPAASKRGLELQVEVPPTPVRIVADGGRLGQVVANLLTNAVKFAPENGIVRLRLFRSPALTGVVGLSVWNSGEGLAENDLERIFEKFEQARTPPSRRARGTGLGLSICRGIVEAHGGAIWAESVPSEGVCFVAVLPDEPPRGERPERPAPSDGAGVVVLDAPDTAALIRGALASRGVRCLEASTLEDALALVRRARPRLVVWDPRLPALADAPFADLLRHDADARQAALLAFSEPAGREAAFRAGADGFLPKPGAAPALAAAAEGLLRKGRGTGARVLVVDDDPSIRAICAEVLASQGFAVFEAGSCAEARALVAERRPHALLLDVQLPDGDGFGLLEGLQAERAADPFAVVFLTARGEVADKVRGLRLGGDDYLTKPFDAQELVARVDAVLRRRDAALQASPMTRLPGGRVIDQEVERRLAARAPFALSYVDLDNLKAFNDHYGYAKADGVLLQTAGILREMAAAHGGKGAFLGHIGGDDFVLLTAPERAERLCREVITAFDRVIPLYYDREDRDRGFIEAADRYGTRRRFPLLSVSIATVVAPPGRYSAHADLSRAAATLKHRAKQILGSVHLVDAGDGGAAA